MKLQSRCDAEVTTREIGINKETQAEEEEKQKKDKIRQRKKMIRRRGVIRKENPMRRTRSETLTSRTEVREDQWKNRSSS